jgi:hypothetical protein
MVPRGALFRQAFWGAGAGQDIVPNGALPLLSKLAKQLLGREVEVDLGRGQVIMPKETL